MDNCAQQNICFRRFGTMLDCSRGAVMTVDAIKKWIDITSEQGYNTLMLYTEDTYEIDGQPYFGYLRGRYSQAELRQIDDYAFAHGVELIPCIQTLAHLEAIFRWSVYDKVRDCDDILLPGSEDTYALIEAMFSAVSKCFRSRIVNIGMDEAHMLGRGKYQDLNGYKDRFDILLNHLQKTSQLAKKYGLELIMWGDMFFRLLGGNYYDSPTDMPERVNALIPDNVNLIYWDYYSRDKERYGKNIRSHAAVKENIWFAGGLWSWAGLVPHNQFSIDASKAALEACAQNGVQDVFFTMWGDDGAECSKFSLLPALYYAAQTARGISDESAIKKGFQEKYGIAFDDFMLLDLTDSPNQEEDRICNPDAYMLYNDCLLGIFDPTVETGGAQAYAQYARKLAAFEDNQCFGYLFSSVRSLCDVLSVKYDLGVRTRNAYQAGDMDGLNALLEDYDLLLQRIGVYYERFRTQWFRENKPFGFEIHDIRLGGLQQRVAHCRERIAAFTAGKLPSLPELEEILLPPFLDQPQSNGKAAYLKLWNRSAMVDV